MKLECSNTLLEGASDRFLFLGFSWFLLSLSWVQLVPSPSLGFGRFLLSLLSSVGSFSPSLGFS